MKKSVPLSHRIAGIALIIPSSVLSYLFIGAFITREYGLIVPGAFGVVGVVFGIFICRGLFAFGHTTEYNDCDVYDCDETIVDLSMADGLNGHEFEYFCADLLRKNGFIDVSVTKSSGDQGVDILAIKDGVKYAVQCKNYVTPLGNTPVQEVAAGKLFYGCHVGVVLTNSTFTPGAVSLANATGVLLWDRNVLADLIQGGQATADGFLESAEDVVSVTEPSENIDSSLYDEPLMVDISDDARDKVSTKISNNNAHFMIDNIDVVLDLTSIERAGIKLDNFGIEMDEDCMEFLFDIFSKNGRSIKSDIEIVCNLYSGNRKIAVESESVFKEDFHGRDSADIYFNKKQVCSRATRMELFCQKV